MDIMRFSDENVIAKWLLKIDSIKRFSMQTGILIGTGNAFLRQRLDLHAKCSTTVAITESSFEKSHAHHVHSHLSPLKC